MHFPLTLAMKIPFQILFLSKIPTHQDSIHEIEIDFQKIECVDMEISYRAGGPLSPKKRMVASKEK